MKQRYEDFIYHMLKHLLKLWVRMISTGFHVVVTKPFVKFLKYLAQTNGLQLNEYQKLYKVSSNNISVWFSLLDNFWYTRLLKNIPSCVYLANRPASKPFFQNEKDSFLTLQMHAQ